MSPIEEVPLAVRIPRGLSILLVEDDIALAGVMSHWARWVGAAMDTAAFGAEALVFAVQKPYDAVLLDLTLPDMEGWAVYDRMIELRPHLASRVIVLTGGAVNKTARAFLDRTSCPVVLKPFELETLARQITKLKCAAA
jgi:two-component system, cell cycle sensor histidine kinase and response regulator CckA